MRGAFRWREEGFLFFLDFLWVFWPWRSKGTGVEPGDVVRSARHSSLITPLDRRAHQRPVTTSPNAARLMAELSAAAQAGDVIKVQALRNTGFHALFARRFVDV